MIIGFDGSRAFLPEKAYRTGTENYSYQLLKSLAKIDTKNKYLIYLRGGVRTGAKWPDNFKFKTLNINYLWTQVGLAAQTFKDNLDLLFIPAHTLPVIRRPGLKTVVTVHDLGSEYLPQAHQVKQRLYLSFMQKQQLKKATGIIAVSKATKSDLVNRLGIKAEKITVVYEGYDKKLFKPVKAETLINRLRQFNLIPGHYFLFVGTVQPRKNLERLIKAYKNYLARGDSEEGSWRVPAAIRQLVENEDTRRDTELAGPRAIKLVLAGQKGWLADNIYRLPKALNIESQVRFLGYVPESDLPVLYSGARALIFPSLFEGFGLPILEAQACGCPVVAANLSSMPEVAGKGAILVNPLSVDDIVKGMERLEGTAHRQQLIKAGHENCQRFSWEKCARETLEVLEGIGILKFKIMKVQVLGVKIDDITIDQAMETVTGWIKSGGKHYIATPNPEMLVVAQTDRQFQQALNAADLAIPDGVGLKLSGKVKNTVYGTDLMELLCKRAADLGFTIGLLGGARGVAEECAECLRKKYPKLKVVYIDSGGAINKQGEWLEGNRKAFGKMDILFVAFGHPKQEKWMFKNLKSLDVKVMMGVGGAFDYLSGRVARPPQFIRNLGLEWLFRLITQPWRIKRQLSLIQYLWLLTNQR